MRALILARAAAALVACGALVVTASGCGKTRACKAGTVLVTASGSAADGADSLSLDISVGGGAPKTVTSPWRNGGGTIEIDFPAGYPRGQTVTVAATALQAGTAIATATATVTLADACEPLALSFGGSGGTDGGGDGMCTPTVTSCPATVTCGKADDGCGNLTVDCGPCQVNAADRVIAAAGDTITLEGKLADPTEVTFPGGTKATATLLGPNRATVVVPSDAGEGQMSIVSNHSPAVTLPFRRTTYTVEIQNFRQSYEQVSYARQMPQMSEGRFWTAAVAGDKYVYVLGGTTSVSGDSGVSVEQAMINADGTLGAMRLSPNKLTTAHADAPAVRIGDKVYVLGGNDGNVGGTTAASVTNVVEVATIGADGRIGTFSAAPATLKATRAIGASTFNGVWGHSAAVIGNWLYVFGGSLGPFCSGVATTQIERAPINPDGTIGDFAIATAALTTAESDGAAIVDGNYVYVVSDTKIQFSAIMPNGDLAGFNDAGVTLPNSRAHAGAAIINNALYLFGGGAASVLKLAVNSDGTLGAPATTTATMLGNFTKFGWALVGHNLYTFGGGDGNACGAAFIQFGRVIERASLEGGGLISAFTSVPAVNTTAERSSFVAVVVGSRVYAIGGQVTATDPDVDVAPVGADGKLGNFATQAGVALVTKRFRLSGAVVGDNVYVLGGADSSNAYPSAVEVAPIAADGTLGTFAVAKVNGTGANVAVTTARAGATVFLSPGDHNGGNPDYLCIAGGANASAVTAVECAIVNADGTLAGNLAPLMPASNLGSARPSLPSPYVGDKVYVMAGSSASTTLDAATYDATSGQPGSFAGSVTLSNQIMYRVGWSIGSAVFIAAGDGGLGAYPPDIQLSPIAANGSLANFTTSTLSLAFGRVGGRAVVLGSRAWVFGGVNNLGAADTEVAELR